MDPDRAAILSNAPPPSSFDNNTEFYEESRWQKLRRRLIEEPLIPLGCALTCWALYEATRSMRSGDKHKTNRMFRRRIYAQGFTILAMVGGQIYWESDRQKRKQFDGLIEDKKKKEKHDQWIRELEVREQEDEELRKMRERVMRGRGAEEAGLSEQQARAQEARNKDEAGQNRGGLGTVRSVLEAGEGRRGGRILQAAWELWQSRR